MKKFVLIAIILLFVSLGAFIVLRQRQSPPVNTNTNSMEIKSPAFQNNGNIPSKYTCDGENINPPLTISGVPEKAKSLALIVDDPDSPMGTWVHWLIWNIDPALEKITENIVPGRAVEGINGFGKSGYGGPCPGSGSHHYFFKLYALDTTISIPPASDKKAVEEAMKGHILASGELIGLYSRKR
jgi:Raf kinase inhibitor-like YbhB/YbcL family protein